MGILSNGNLKNNILVLLTKLGVGLVLLGLLFYPIQASAESLNDLLNQRDQLDQQIAQKQALVNEKKAEITTIQNQIAGLNDQIDVIQAKINQTQAQIDQTRAEISLTQEQITKEENELKIQNDYLNEALVSMYEISNKSVMEMVLGSDTFSQVISDNEYVDTLETKIETTIAEIEKIKKDLEDKRAELKRKDAELGTLQNQQQVQRNGLEFEKSKRNSSLSDVKDQKSQYQNMVDQLQKDRDNVSAAIYDLRERNTGDTIINRGGGGYPYSCGQIDPQGFYTCECTSYASWYWNNSGKTWRRTRPGGENNAWQWPMLARDQGYSVSQTPRVDAIISWGQGGMFGSTGHVAIVKSVNSDGTIDVKEYNWEKYSYTERHLVPYDKYGVSYNFIY